MPDDAPPEGHVQPTSAGAVAGWAVLGLVVGWALRPLAMRLGETAPVVTWLQAGALWLVVVILGLATWSMRRMQAHGVHLEPHRAVNRLVLAKACALVGALVAGGYAGYAVSWLGLEAELADERMVRSGVAALAGAGMCATALLLERACRVRKDDADT